VAEAARSGVHLHEQRPGLLAALQLDEVVAAAERAELIEPALRPPRAAPRRIPGVVDGNALALGAAAIDARAIFVYVIFGAAVDELDELLLGQLEEWNYPAPWGLGRAESIDPGLHLCCPTPIKPETGLCTKANGCMTSEACNDARDPLSVVHTDYVAAMHAMCPSAYAFSYDDAAGLHACPSDTRFEVTFCP
jgi:hypothetical protein